MIDDGEYSDYHVIGIYSTKKRAEAVRAWLNAGDIREMLLDPGVEAVNQGLVPWRVYILRDGQIEGQAEPQDSYYWNMETRALVWERTKAPAYQGTGMPDVLEVTALAKSQKHAIKIANEIRTRMIATGEWQ
jgi:hypothetical protein